MLDGNSAFSGDQWPLNIQDPETRVQNPVNIGNFFARENKKVTIQVQKGNPILTVQLILLVDGEEIQV